MKRKGIIQAAIVAGCTLLIGLLIQVFLALHASGNTTAHVIFTYLSSQYSFFQRSGITWAVVIFCFMLMTGRLSFKEMVIFSFVTCIGYALLASVYIRPTGVQFSIGGWLPTSQSFGPYAYPVFFIGALYWSIMKKDIFSGGLSLLWLVLDLVFLPVCVGLKDSGSMAGETIKAIYDALFILVPVIMLAFAAKEKLRKQEN